METRGYKSNGNGDGGRGRSPFGGRRPRPPKELTFDYRDPDNLRPFTTEHGKIVPRRISKLSAKQQRDLSCQVKRARQLGLLVYTNQRND